MAILGLLKPATQFTANDDLSGPYSLRAGTPVRNLRNVAGRWLGEIQTRRGWEDCDFGAECPEVGDITEIVADRVASCQIPPLPPQASRFVWVWKTATPGRFRYECRERPEGNYFEVRTQLQSMIAFSNNNEVVGLWSPTIWADRWWMPDGWDADATSNQTGVVVVESLEAARKCL